jgi:hypothetical protein
MKLLIASKYVVRWNSHLEDNESIMLEDNESCYVKTPARSRSSVCVLIGFLNSCNLLAIVPI